MNISEFFDIFDLSHPKMEKVHYFVYTNDYNNAKRELLKYFINRKASVISSAEAITPSDAHFPLAYISRHGILSGPNESDVYLASMFLPGSSEYTSLDVFPFLKGAEGFKNTFSFMIMSRQKDALPAFFYSPASGASPYIQLLYEDGTEKKLYPDKCSYVSAKAPSEPLSGKEIYEICEHGETDRDAFSSLTGRAYLSFDLSHTDLTGCSSARFAAKITLPESVTTKELLFFNISDTSWDSSLTWNKIKGNVYSWESSPSGPFWEKVPGSDDEYLNVICRFWFARPMAYQYLSDVEKNAVYGEKLLFLMNAFSEKKDGGFNRVLETGERLSNFTAVLNALIDTPVMTADYLVSILWMMYRDIKSLCENPDLGWSNWAVVRTSGLSKALDYLPELKMHEEWKTTTREVMSSLFDKMYSPDFSFREAGLAYSFWCTNLFASAINSAHMNNDPYSAFMRSRIEKAFDASLDLLYPNLCDTNIGDSNYQDKSAYLSSVGALFPTKKLKALLEGASDTTIPASVCYPYAGSVIMRRSFSKDNPLYLAMHTIPFDGHAHNDLSSLVLFASTRPLITDSGRYGYSKSEISSYLKTEAAHNSIEIEGEKYSAHSESEAKITRFATNSAFDYAEASCIPYSEIGAVHTRRVLFIKNEGFVIVSDKVCTEKDSCTINQNWNFMPSSQAECDTNLITTHFAEGDNILIACPDAASTRLSDSIFSSGYGIAQKSCRGAFSQKESTAVFTSLLFPFKGEAPHVTSSSLSGPDKSFSGAVFDIGSSRGVFYTKHSDAGSFLDCCFDGDTAFILNGRMYLINGSTLNINGMDIVKSPAAIKDMYVRISGTTVEIVSSSLKECTLRDEAVKIYAPKTTQVLLNGKSIPFSLFSEYVYAVSAQ